jgi:hypothetical protein
MFFIFYFLSDSRAEDLQKLSSDINELVLDGGFVVPKSSVSCNGLEAEELVSNNAFLAPEINSFGRSFRSDEKELKKIYVFFLFVFI